MSVNPHIQRFGRTLSNKLTWRYLEVGDEVYIKDGPFRGKEGKIQSIIWQTNEVTVKGVGLREFKSFRPLQPAATIESEKPIPVSMIALKKDSLGVDVVVDTVTRKRYCAYDLAEIPYPTVPLVTPVASAEVDENSKKNSVDYETLAKHLGKFKPSKQPPIPNEMDFRQVQMMNWWTEAKLDKGLRRKLAEREKWEFEAIETRAHVRKSIHQP